MAKLYIKEFSTVAVIDGKAAPLWPESSIAEQAVSYSTTTQSSAFNRETKYIAITSDGIFSYAVGSNPTATTSNFRVPADQILVFEVQPGDKIAAVTNT